MEDDLNFLKSKMNSTFFCVEDNLHFFINGRQPQFFLMEDDLKNKYCNTKQLKVITMVVTRSGQPSATLLSLRYHSSKEDSLDYSGPSFNIFIYDLWSESGHYILSSSQVQFFHLCVTNHPYWLYILTPENYVSANGCLL